MHEGPNAEHALFMSRFDQTLILGGKKMLKCQISRKSAHDEPNFSMRIDRRTDRHGEARLKTYNQQSTDC